MLGGQGRTGLTSASRIQARWTVLDAYGRDWGGDCHGRDSRDRRTLPRLGHQRRGPAGDQRGIRAPVPSVSSGQLLAKLLNRDFAGCALSDTGPDGGHHQVKPRPQQRLYQPSAPLMPPWGMKRSRDQGSRHALAIRGAAGPPGHSPGESPRGVGLSSSRSCGQADQGSSAVIGSTSSSSFSAWIDASSGSSCSRTAFRSVEPCTVVAPVT